MAKRLRKVELMLETGKITSNPRHGERKYTQRETRVGGDGSWKLKYVLVHLIHPVILQLLSLCYSDVLPVWGMCTTRVPGDCGGQERALELLGLELQTRVGIGVWNRVLRKAAGVLNCTSPAHLFWVQVSRWPAAYWLGYLAGSQTPEVPLIPPPMFGTARIYHRSWLC